MRLVRLHLSKITAAAGLALITACSGATSGTQSTDSSAPSTANAAIKNPHLFEVRKDGRISWLFGTYHIGVPYEAVAKSVEPRLQAARVVFFEIHDVEFAKRMAVEPVETLLNSDLDFDAGTELSPEIRARLIDEYKLAPKIAGAMRSGSCQAFMWGFNLSLPDLDGEMILRATALKKKIEGLDTNELRKAADQSHATANQQRNSDQPRCNLVDVYLTGTTAASLRAEFQEARDEYRTGAAFALLREKESVNFRNRAWVKRLRPELEIGGVFVAVGAGHLYGRESLVALLQRDGYTITRVR